MLEADVGGEHFSEWEAMKEWCTFKGFNVFKAHSSDIEPFPELTVFKAPGIIEIQQGFLYANNGYRFPEFSTFFREKLEPEKRRMCWKSTLPEFSEDVLGVTNVCIKTIPERKVIEINMDRWGRLTRDEAKYLSKQSWLSIKDKERWEGFKI